MLATSLSVDAQSFDEFDALADKCAPDVSKDTLQALIKTESSMNPLAIAVVGGKVKQPTSLKDALNLVKELEKNGSNFSLGLGQINKKNFDRLGVTAEDMFEPCKNLQAAQHILKECFVKAQKEDKTEGKQLGVEQDGAKQAVMRAQFLQRAVVLGKNIIIAGETGSGKTTFMKTLMQSIPTDQRLITIEDVPELLWGLPNHHNVVNLLYPSEAKDDAVITAASLMRSCLRMKPDRILLAELRGGETFDFLNVCLSGHGGTITSCHAGSSKGVFEYLALKVMQSSVGKSLPYPVIFKLLHLVLDVIVCIHNDKQNGLGRHITELWYDPESKFKEY